MTINFDGKEKEVKFSYNSLILLENFKLSVLDTLADSPFKMLAVIKTLLFAGLNHNPKEKISLAEVDSWLEEFVNAEGTCDELLTQLFEELQKSPFFKMIQKKTPEKKTRK